LLLLLLLLLLPKSNPKLAVQIGEDVLSMGFLWVDSAFLDKILNLFDQNISPVVIRHLEGSLHHIVAVLALHQFLKGVGMFRVDGWSRHYTIDDFIFLIIRSELQTFFNYV
jgi:hypothetical protein